MPVPTLKVLASLLQMHGPGATIQSDHQGIDALLDEIRGQISTEGVVQPTPGATEVAFRKGAFVRSISAEDLREATAVRASLEALALRLAAPRIAPEKLEELSQVLGQMDEAQKKRNVEEFTRLHWQFHKILIDLSGNQILARTHDMVTQPFISCRFTYRYLKRLDRFEGVSHRDIYELLASGQVLKASSMMEQHAMAFLDPSLQEVPEPVEKKRRRRGSRA